MVDAPLEEIKSFVSRMEDQEKEAKRREIEAYFFQRSEPLGALAGQVLNSPAFFETKWLNKTTSAKTWQTAVDEKISKAAWNLKSIETSAGPYAKYLETLSTEGLAEYRSRLAAVPLRLRKSVQCGW